MFLKVIFKKLQKYHVELLEINKILYKNEKENKEVKTNTIVGAGELSI